MRRHLDDLGFLLILAILVVTLVFLVLPIVVSIMMSFDGREYLGKFPPPDYSLHWYARFFSDALLSPWPEDERDHRRGRHGGVDDGGGERGHRAGPL